MAENKILAITQTGVAIRYGDSLAASESPDGHWYEYLPIWDEVEATYAIARVESPSEYRRYRIERGGLLGPVVYGPLPYRRRKGK